MNTKRPRSRLIFTIVTAGILALIGWALFSRSEPAYEGKPLSAWAEQFGSNNWSGGRGSAAHREAESAIRQIGTNGIPFLLDLMWTRDSESRQKLRAILPLKWHDTFRLRDESGETRRFGAYGIAALGTNAAMAVPALIEIGTNHPDEDGRYVAVFALRTLGPTAEPAIPFFIQCLTNSKATIRHDAALGLGTVGLQPELAVPALISYLEFAKMSGEGFEISDTIRSLACFWHQCRTCSAGSPVVVGPC